MKDFVTPKIDGKIKEYRVLAGIEAEIEEKNKVVFQPRLYLIDMDGEKALQFCYRKGKKTGRKGGYGMIIDEETIMALRDAPIDSKSNLPLLREHLKRLMEIIP